MNYSYESGDCREELTAFYDADIRIIEKLRRHSPSG